MEDATEAGPVVADMMTGSTDVDACHNILELPDDIKNRIAQFLNSNDALGLAQSCKDLEESLSLSSLLIGFSDCVPWSGGSYATGPRHFRRIPLFFPKRLHSVDVSLLWNVRGGGPSQESRIYVVASRQDGQPYIPASIESCGTVEESLPSEKEEGDAFYGDRLVFRSIVARHTGEQMLRFSFQPKPDEIYRLCYMAKCRTDDSWLEIRNFRIRLLVQNDKGHHLQKIFSSLQNLADFCHPLRGSCFCNKSVSCILTVPPFFLFLLHDVADLLSVELLESRLNKDYADFVLGADDEPYQGLTSLSPLLNRSGIPVNEGSMEAMIEIVNAVVAEHIFCDKDDEAAAVAHRMSFTGVNLQQVNDNDGPENINGFAENMALLLSHLIGARQQQQGNEREDNGGEVTVQHGLLIRLDDRAPGDAGNHLDPGANAV
jgi:hypothetical protein